MQRNGIDLKLLSELLKNSRRSDRAIAEILGDSQPTITRHRIALEEKAVLRGYTAIPDLAKIGVNITAITFLEGNKEKMMAAAKIPEVLLALAGEGFKKGAVCLSVHTDYGAFAGFRCKIAELGLIAESFLAYNPTGTIKHLDLHGIGKLLL